MKLFEADYDPNFEKVGSILLSACPSVCPSVRPFKKKITGLRPIYVIFFEFLSFSF